MPDLTFHISQECAQIRQGVHRSVLSSDGKRHYRVYVTGDGENADCTCPGYKYHGKCRHVEQVRRELCGWHMEYSEEQQTLEQNVRCVCPRCGGETELVRVAA